jgi:predicted CoA-binding protein
MGPMSAVDRSERDRARDQLDLEEGLGPVPVLDAEEARDLLAAARTIAVVGASPRAGRPSHDVMATLLRHGYTCVPINPTTGEVLGITAYPDLGAAVAANGAPFDIVDVFRRPEHVPEVAREAVATGCRSLWLQLGIVSWEGAAIAHAAGLPVVMNRCTAIDLRALVASGRRPAAEPGA